MSGWIVFLESFVGAALLIAAMAKAFSRTSVAGFLLALGAPSAAVRAVSPLVPAVEAALGALLLLGVARPPLAVAAAVLCLGFFAAQVGAFVRGGTTGCRCYGSLDSESGARVGLLRAGVLLAVATVGAILVSTGGSHGSLGLAAHRWAAFAGTTVAFCGILGSALVAEVADFYARVSSAGAQS